MRKAIRTAKFFVAVVAFYGAGSLVAKAGLFPEAVPKVVQAGTPTKVTVWCNITDPKLVQGSVQLQVNGKGLTVNGNAAPATIAMTAPAKSTIYSATVTVIAQLGPNNTPGVFAFRVGANFNGTAGQVQSGDVDVAAVDSFISDFTPGGIQTFLQRHSSLSATGFLMHLNPTDFSRDWILMTDSASSQTGTAQQPRVIVQSVASDKLFGLAANSSLIEYIQWDPVGKQFHFHSIDLPAKTVTTDVGSCANCHSIGTRQNGGGWPYPRPNWDAYDSWGGALPYNRDRVYQNSTEATAMAALLKGGAPFFSLDLPAMVTKDTSGNAVMNPGITRDSNGNVVIPFSGPGTDPTGTLSVSYTATNGIPSYPGMTKQEVAQGGPFFLMQSTATQKITVGDLELAATDPVGDGGRGVAMFDHLSQFNAERVAQELVDSFTIGKTKVDIRPVALAIAMGCVGDPTILANLEKFAPPAAITKLLKAEGMANFTALYKDTLSRQHSLPQMKANQEAVNVAGLLNAYSNGSNASAITNQVAQRSKNNPGDLTTPIFALDTLTGFMIDREDYSGTDQNTKLPYDNTQTIALFRLFLEPVGEPVNKWTMSIDGSVDHSGTYTFADQPRKSYLPYIQAELAAVLDDPNCATLEARSLAAFANFN